MIDNVALRSAAFDFAKNWSKPPPEMEEQDALAHAFRMGAKWAVSRDRMLEAFANALGVESAEGWKTGEAIMKELGL